MRIERSLFGLAALTAALVMSPVFAAGVKHDFAAGARAVVHAFAAGDFKTPEAGFTIQMRQALPAAKLEAVWRRITERAGAFEKTGETTSISYQGHTIVLVKTIFKKTPLWTQVVYDSDGKIAGLYFKPME